MQDVKREPAGGAGGQAPAGVETARITQHRSALDLFQGHEHFIPEPGQTAAIAITAVYRDPDCVAAKAWEYRLELVLPTSFRLLFLPFRQTLIRTQSRLTQSQVNTPAIAAR